MIDILHHPMDALSAPLLLVQAPAQSGLERWVDVAADVATIIIAIALIVVAVVTIQGALKLRRMIRGIRGSFDPAILSLTAASDNARAVSGALRRNVEELSGTVSEANGKVRRATEAAEARLGELDALLGLVQREAEELFVRTASAVRGVQAGAGALRGAGRGRSGDHYDGGLDDLPDDDTMDEADPVPDVHVTRRRRSGRDIFD